MKRVGVVPRETYASRHTLLEALEAVFPVQFEARDPGHWRDLDGVVAFAGGERAAREANAAGLPALAAEGEAPRMTASAPVTLADSELLDRRLRGQTISDHSAGTMDAVPVERGSVALASSGRRPLWAARDDRDIRRDVVACLPGETDTSAPLASLLTTGHFLGLLPLVHFLRLLTAQDGWSAPPLRAALIIDDPNLHAASYGYVEYGALAEQAAADGYHVAIAMVPLDAWLARRAAVDVFRRHAPHLSLVVHGNDHARHELARPESEDAALRLIAQGLRRVAGFERRSGLSVGRVMVPPHERTSVASLRAMRAVGFEAVCLDWQCPWLPGPVTRAGIERQLAGWHPAELLGGGVPTMARSYWTDPAPDLALRAFRDHPLLLFGHHGDAAEPEVVSRAVAQVNRLGGVHWQSLPEIARSNFSTRRTGQILWVQMTARRISVEIPPGVQAVRVQTPMIHELLEGTAVQAGGEASSLEPAGASLQSGPLPVAPGGAVEVSLALPGGVDPADVSRPRWRPWPLLRRGMSEGRDRLGPWVQRARPAR